MSELKPSDFMSVLAKIQHQTDLGLSEWCEVVYYDEVEGAWKSYSGSKTFENGEKVIEWVYVDGVFRLQAEKAELIKALERSLSAACDNYSCSEDFCDEMLALINKLQ